MLSGSIVIKNVINVDTSYWSNPNEERFVPPIKQRQPRTSISQFILSFEPTSQSFLDAIQNLDIAEVKKLLNKYYISQEIITTGFELLCSSNINHIAFELLCILVDNGADINKISRFCDNILDINIRNNIKHYIEYQRHIRLYKIIEFIKDCDVEGLDEYISGLTDEVDNDTIFEMVLHKGFDELCSLIDYDEDDFIDILIILIRNGLNYDICQSSINKIRNIPFRNKIINYLTA